MPTEKEYDIEKRWLGGRRVSYACPHCGEPLRSPLTDAGQHDTCPSCCNVFVVPGSADLLRITETEKFAKQYEEHLKAQAKEESRRRKEHLAKQRAVAVEKVVAKRAEQERLTEEARQARSAAEDEHEEPSQQKRLPWRLGGGAAATVVLLLIYLFARGSSLREKLVRCESHGIVEARVSYAGFFGTDTVVFDLLDGGTSSARRIDPVHLLMQFSCKLNLQSIDRLVLARNGNKRFYIMSSNLRPLSDSYAGGGRVWAFNNLPANVRRMDGTRAFDEWTGGWLGVLQKQTEDLNRFITVWTEYGSGGDNSTTPSFSSPAYETDFSERGHTPDYAGLSYESDGSLRNRVRETLQDMENNVPETLQSAEDNLPEVMADMESRMMADAAKYGLSPTEVRAQMREFEVGAREQIRDMEDDVRKQIRGMEDDIIESIRSNGQ